MPNDRNVHIGLVGSEEDRNEVERTLRDITARASANAEGEVGVGLSVLVDGVVRSIGATTAAAQAMDSGQAEDGVGPCLLALHTGVAVSVTDYGIDARWPGSSRRASQTGVRSSLSLPLTTPADEVLGALNVYSDSPDAFSVEVGSSLGAFAAQATTSLVLLTAMQAQRADSAYVTAFSRVVQRSLRTVLPEVTGLELVGGSIPASSLGAVGGDWYDALVLPDGDVVLVIGDVMGHDIEAVTAMAQLRTMVRSGAWLGHRADQVVAMADELSHEAGITETATLFYGRLTWPEDAGRDAAVLLEYCNAGHLLPLVRDPTGRVTPLDGGSRMLLGALGIGAPLPPDTPVGQEVLRAGTILLLYTDGLVERPGVSLEEATDELVRALTEYDPATPLTELCQQLLAGATARDDTTVFTVRVV